MLVFRAKTALASRNSSQSKLFSFFPSEMRLCLLVAGRPWRGSKCSATRGPVLATGTLLPAPRVFPVPPSPPAALPPTPSPGPHYPRPATRSLGLVPTPPGVTRTPGPSRCSHGAEGGGVFSVNKEELGGGGWSDTVIFFFHVGVGRV